MYKEHLERTIEMYKDYNIEKEDYVRDCEIITMLSQNSMFCDECIYDNYCFRGIIECLR